MINGKVLEIKCSNCNKHLVNVWITQNEKKILNKGTDIESSVFDWDIVAECPFCNDRSFHHQVSGGFYLGSTPSCRVKDTQMEGNKVLVTVTKGNPQYEE